MNSGCRGEGRGDERRKAREKAKITYAHAAETHPLAPVPNFDNKGLERDNTDQL